MNLFSVVIPLYNKKDYVLRALDSVFAQSNKHYEVIVIDDGSRDGGGDLVEQQFGTRVKLIRQENQGVSVARNTGIQAASNPFVAFLDADDYWHPAYLEAVAKVISENPDVGIVGCHYDSSQLAAGPKFSYFKLENYFKEAVRNTWFFTSATCVRTAFFSERPGFDPKLKFGEDIDVWLRASLHFGDGMYILDTLVFYSREDQGAATQKVYPLEETLIPKLLDDNYYASALGSSTCSQDTFKAFQSKWVYLNLFPNFALPTNHRPIRQALSKIPRKYQLVHSLYRFPSIFFTKVLAVKGLTRMFRNCLKFCFRYIYS